MLDVKDLHVAYGRIAALRGVDLHVPAGAVVALLGPNGAGKSTLLGAISGLVPLQRGQVSFGTESLVGRRAHDIAGMGVVQIPEGRGIFPGLSVRDNLAVVSSVRPGSDVDAVLERFPRLQQRLSQAAGTMSGGEQQMLAVALALLAQPKVLLIDELSLGLAPRIVDELFGVLGNLRDEGLTILLVEQFVHRALSLADRAYVLYRGQVVFSGTATELEASGVEDAYLGGGAGGAGVAEVAQAYAHTARPASTQLRVPVRAEEARRLAALAESRGVSVEELVRQAVAAAANGGSNHGNGTTRRNGRPSRRASTARSSRRKEG